jgi:hypothetical protein
VDEVVRDVDALESRAEAVALEHVAADDLTAAFGEVSGPRGVAGEASDAFAVVDQRPREQAADVAGRAGDEEAPLSRSDRR